nr:2-succinyl-5-enolpyruvyl-6-hydroxy-3-cyclohexene-1-carboxylic-acid synthase [Nocardioidaceae bacterium]
MNPSTQLARVIVDELARAGVRDAVLAPGSRSAPLALALHDADSTRRIRLHVRIDERSAGFLALGLAKASRRPVPVVTTSGTAVANLHPAVLEAHHAGVPLVVLSADRPTHLRGSGANQTTDQVKIFGPAVRFFAECLPPARDVGQVVAVRATVDRAVAAATGTRTSVPGPVHINVPFEEPLLPDVQEAATWPPGREHEAPWTRVGGPPSAPPTTILP